MKWTKEMLQEEANKYTNRMEFRENSKAAYRYSYRNHIMNELFEKHINKGYIITWTKKKLKYTNKQLQEEANKYFTRGEFIKNNKPAYQYSCSKNMIDDLFKNHKNNGYYIKWTDEKLQEESNKYCTRCEFQQKSNGAYLSAVRRNLMDDLFKNHNNNGYSDKYSKNYIYFVYVYELIDYNKAYIGLTINIDRRDKEHVFDQNEKLNKFCKESNISYPKYKILDSNLNSIDAKEAEIFWIDYYKQNNWKLFNIAKGGSLGGKPFKWTENKLIKYVKKYKTRGDFCNDNESAYNSANRLKIMDKLFENHINSGYTNRQVKEGYWTKEKIQEEANKYNTIMQFRKECSKAYHAASNLKIIDELFKNHINQGRTAKHKYYWTTERLQEEANKYKTRNDFRKNDINSYSYSKTKKILNELFKNHINQGYIQKQKKSE